jgi:hypothetical protein
MQKVDSYKKVVLIYGAVFFLIQLILAVVFYRERLYADSSFFVFQTVNKGWFHIEHGRFLLAACEVLPLIGSYLGLSMKAILILYSLNHVLYFLALFLILVLKLDDIYGGMAIMLVLVLNVLCLYVMPYLESWYAAGLAVLLFSVLKKGNKTWGSIVLAILLELTIIFSHPGNFLLLLMIILLFISLRKESFSVKFQNIPLLMLLVLAASFIYKYATLDKYESGQLGWALHTGDNNVPILALLKTSCLQISKEFIKNLIVPTLMLALTPYYYIKNSQYRRAAIVLLTFVLYVIIINFFFGETTITMYSAIHYIPLVAALIIPFCYDVLPSFTGRVKGVAIFLLFIVIGVRSMEQVYSVKPYSCCVKYTERLIAVSNSLGGNKFFIKAPDFVSPYIDWTYPIQTLLLSAEQGKDKCRSIASDEDTATTPETKKMFSDTSFFMISRFYFANNKNLNHKYFNASSGTYKTIDYIRCLDRVFSSNLNWQATGKEWVIKQPELLNGNSVVHLNGDEFGFLIQIPNDSLTETCKKYYAKINLTHVDADTNEVTNALVVCSVMDKNVQKFYSTLKMVGTSNYEFEFPVDNLENDKISFYIWNLKKENFFITNASVQLFKIPDDLFQE